MYMYVLKKRGDENNNSNICRRQPLAKQHFKMLEKKKVEKLAHLLISASFLPEMNGKCERHLNSFVLIAIKNLTLYCLLGSCSVRTEN